ncbi:hypothetical protein COEREDRAFT_79997 [Coemansia reversa NRRL 1564]|uniref:F-box domain-containing protein n=1 Tax=Coemansia reversa (strain ATCC 12441 / NRRL 1564) TaxID=763665 RepID=A0A2G5BGD0_COERN|nr:hypothetical protein COEREDRAFT_79997 [Coemansia reversa NRRL 1564]|eukprot:PIA18053.1 hypothetical protein COEREDRAFT_79997 [Coemansia reversa NRRL 1564]
MWLMCDPTDLPTVGFPENIHRTHNFKSHLPPPLLLPHIRQVTAFYNSGTSSHIVRTYKDTAIPKQLLTPPMSPSDSADEVFAEYSEEPADNYPPRHNLLTLPPHILLSIVSHLYLEDISALSQTCSTLRSYLSLNSPVWPHICRIAFSYTPEYLSNKQIAEYYLHVRGNSRLESRVLVQRERVERAIRCITHA